MNNRSNLSTERGSILLLIVVCIFLIASMTIGILMIATNAAHLGAQQQSTASVFNIAEAGADQGTLYLRQCSIPPSATITPSTLDHCPIDYGTAASAGNYTVTITPAWDNASKFLKTFHIVAVGRIGNDDDPNCLVKTIEIDVRQASFGRYAYFTDKETSSVSGGAIWWKAGEVIDGPVHSNNASGTNFQINYNGSTSPIFLDIVTAAGSAINYNPSAPSNETTFRKIFLDGSKGYQLNVDPIPLPTSTDAQKEAAWGSSSGFPTATSGVYMKSTGTPPGGGIYVRGDCTMTMSVNGSGNQVITIVNNAKTYTFTLNLAAGTTTYSGSALGAGSSASGSPLINGVIYCSGNITQLKGQIADNQVVGGQIGNRSALTIATDVVNGKDITITDNLTYKTKPDKTKPDIDAVNLAAGTLGLVARNVTIASTAPANLEIDAVCMAGGQNTVGSFSVANYDSKSPTGTLSVLGGIIQNSRGPVGTFNPSTGQTTYGYSKNYKYDPRLADNPPPFFPTTGTYERLSWQVKPDH